MKKQRILLKKILNEDNMAHKGFVKMAYLDLLVVIKMLKGRKSVEGKKLDQITKLLISIANELGVLVKR